MKQLKSIQSHMLVLSVCFAVLTLMCGNALAADVAIHPRQVAKTNPNPQQGPDSGKLPMKSDDSSSQLTVERIFSADEFQEARIGTITWSKLGAAYFTLKGSEAENDGEALIRVDAASGTEKVVVPASAFIPSGESKPLSLDGFACDQ